ncbi:MAG TPA: rhodanese-like domain-containing protein [Candidatus Limnocylindrales bacterium]|jgi:rhodanese-related sulfurtransferase
MDQAPAVERISVVEAARRLEAAASNGDPMLVDVREPAEYAQFRATGAVLVPLSVFQLRFSQLPRDRPLLLICAAGQRSLAAGEFLISQGYETVANVEGGSIGWMRAGLPVRTGPPDDGEGDLPA